MKYWIGTVSKEHVLRGAAGGFCQVCHGKAAPLNRMQRVDWLLYYSPKIRLDGHDKLQSFTALGQIIGYLKLSGSLRLSRLRMEGQIRHGYR